MKITLTKEQTEKFLMCFVDDARRIANERKKEAAKQKPINQQLLKNA